MLIGNSLSMLDSRSLVSSESVVSRDMDIPLGKFILTFIMGYYSKSVKMELSRCNTVSHTGPSLSNNGMSLCLINQFSVM